MKYVELTLSYEPPFKSYERTYISYERNFSNGEKKCNWRRK